MRHGLNILLLSCCAACGRSGFNDELLSREGSTDELEEPSSGSGSGSSNGTGAPASLGPGALDVSFATSGVVVLNTPGDSVVWNSSAVTFDTEGRLLVGAASDGAADRDAVVFRLLEDGRIDESFGTQGRATMNWGGSDQLTELEMDDAGRIVFSGATDTSMGRGVVLGRLTEDGALDPSFGAQGGFSIEALVPGNVGNALMARVGGGYLVGGQAGGGGSWDNHFAGFDAEGRLDTSFGIDGSFRFDGPGASDDFGGWLERLPDGGFVHGASSRGFGSSNLAVSMHESDGSLRTSFGDNGFRMVDLGFGDEWVADVLVAPDGSVVLLGSGITATHGDSDVLVYWFEPDGTERLSFGVGGAVALDVSQGGDDATCELVMQPDGKLLIVGTIDGRSAGERDIFVARLDTTGALDASFATGGITQLERTSDERAWSAVYGPQGRLVITGETLVDASDWEVLVARVGL